jgi:hypothetical protein
MDKYRLFVIANGGHVDLHSNGLLDVNFDGTPANEGAAALFTFGWANISAARVIFGGREGERFGLP